MSTSESKQVKDAAWHDLSKSPEARVAALMAEMTLEEKVGQLGSIWSEFNLPKDDGGTEDSPVDNVPIFAEVAQPQEWSVVTKNGLGQLTRVFGTLPTTVKDGIKKVVNAQTRLTSETRLGIPAVVHEECLTGFTTMGATSFPTPLGLAATFDPAIIEKVTRVIGRDMKSVGVHQGLSPVLDVVRDYRWGRVEETFGEDPYLAGICATAYVKGLESQGIVSTLKHFFGHSASKAARNHGPVSMGWRELYDFMLPPFEMAVTEGKARSVMNSYTDVDGLPAGADPKIFTEILRNQMKFTGTVVSDYWAISFLEIMHNVAGTAGEAGALALIAGIDTELPATRCYGDGLIELIRSGKLSEEYVDRALVRVLNQKLELGLLDPDWTPTKHITADLETVDLDTPANRQVALDAAREGVILLSNKDNFLPLVQQYEKIVIVGPCGDDGAAFLGCYSFANHVMAMTPGSGLGIEVPSIYESIAKKFTGSQVTAISGVPVKEVDPSGIEKARAAVDGADLAIVVVGDRAGLFGRGTSGEGNDVSDMALPGSQAELLSRCLDSKTPVIVVSVSGRPYALENVQGRAAAIIQAFMPGEEGGTAIAEVISGAINPSGRLPVEIPSTPTGQPSTYLHPKYGQPGLGISPVDSIPLFTFGHGLSYTQFEYSSLALSSQSISTNGEFVASATVKNVGKVAGSEVVQLYFRDPVAEVARPVIQLLGFARVDLLPGASKKLDFYVHTDRLAYHGREVKRIIDAGVIQVHLGASSTDIKDSKNIQITGPTREVGPQRKLLTDVTVS